MKMLEEDAYRDWVNVSIFYPEGAHTLTVQDVNRDDTPLRFITEPVQFEVCTSTKLLWDVAYDEDSSEHVFTGRLMLVSGLTSIGLSDNTAIRRLEAEPGDRVSHIA